MSNEIDTSRPTTIVAPDGMQLVVNGLVLHGRSSYETQPGDLVSVVRVPLARTTPIRELAQAAADAVAADPDGVSDAAFDAEREAPKWQPIETAPTDETVMLWWPEHGIFIGHVTYDAREARRERVAAQAKRDAAAAEQRGADRMARAMVAALYWRAGECRMWAAEESEPTYLLQTQALEATAYRLERAL